MTITQLITIARKHSGSDSTSYPAISGTSLDWLGIELNAAIETLTSKIIQVCRHFPYDDENFANIAEGTITLEEGVSKYTITDKFLTILEVKVKDTSGKWHIVDPVTQREDGNIVETDEALTGLPTKYRMVGRTMFLRVAPTAGHVTLAAGLLFKYTRTSYQITYDDINTGTLVIGIATPWHTTIANMTALPYVKLYHKDLVPQLERDIAAGISDCVVFAANRLKDRNDRFTLSMDSNK